MQRAKAEADRFTVLLTGATACFVAFVSLGKVFSPQYLVWLIPLGTLASLRAGKRARFWMIAAFALVQIEYPFLYSSLSDAVDPKFGLLIILRNVALWGWTLFLLRAPDCDLDVSFQEVVHLVRTEETEVAKLQIPREGPDGQPPESSHLEGEACELNLNTIR